ncbi:MAG: DedA family protein [Wenzhouxiangellaceae bacterium]|nr:DedA family protein [Wenzhouxiangellaceae bacterium]
MNLPDFQTLLQWAAAHPGWVVTIGLVLAFVEALAVVGVIVPGILLLFLLGALVGWDVPLLTALAIACALGAIAGDGLSYWLGRRAGDGLAQVWPFRTRPQWLEQGRAFFDRHGGKSVFIARFIGPLRPIVPLVAGSMNMSPSKFLPRMILACLVWAPSMLLPGVLFGESLALAAEFGGRLTLLLVVVIVGLGTLAWLARVVYEFGARRNQWWMKNLALWLRRHPRFGRILGPLFEPGRREVLTVVALGLVLVASIAALVAALLLAPFSTDAWEAGFRYSGLAASLRSHLADPVFLVIALALSPTVMLSLVVWTAFLLVVQGRRVALTHWLLATVGGLVLAVLLNALTGWLLGRPAEPGVIGQLPQIGFVLAVLVFGFAALIITRDLRPRRRKWLVLATTLTLALGGFAQFYFAQATVNGLIAGLALALGWLALTGIAYRTRARALRAPTLTLLLLVAGWLVAAATATLHGYATLAADVQLERPLRTVAADHWWRQGWAELPMRKSRIGRVEQQRFDLQLAGSLASIDAALASAGWSKPPELDRRGLRALVSARLDPERLGHLPRDFGGQPESLLRRSALTDGRVAILRAWDSGLRLEPDAVPVWLVQVRAHEPQRRFGFFNSWSDLPAARDQAITRLRTDMTAWQWRYEGPAAPWRARPVPSLRRE